MMSKYFTIFIVLFITILVAFAVTIGYISTQKIVERSQKLKELEIIKKCLVCCVQAQECATADTCKEKLDPKLCNRSKVVLSQQYLNHGRETTLKMIVKDVLDEYNYNQFDSDIDGKFQNPIKVRTELNKLDRLLMNPSKPRSHLAGVIHFNGTLLHRTKNTNEYRNAYWEWRNNSRFSGAYNGMKYNPLKGALEIPRTGFYYVYLHTTFYTKSVSDEKAKKPNRSDCYLSHMVKKENRRKSKNLHKLMTSKESRSCSHETTKLKRHPDYKTNEGFHTLDSNAVYKLEEGDELTVYYEMPDYVGVASLEEESYFGVFMM